MRGTTAKIKDSLEFNRIEIEDGIGEFEIILDLEDEDKVIIKDIFDDKIEVTWDKMSSTIILRDMSREEVI